MSNTLTIRSNAFADAWHERPDTARDASTLAHLLNNEFRKVAEEARADERQRIAAKLADLVNP